MELELVMTAGTFLKCFVSASVGVGLIACALSDLSIKFYRWN
jgi:hypothetical protein